MSTRSRNNVNPLKGRKTVVRLSKKEQPADPWSLEPPHPPNLAPSSSPDAGHFTVVAWLRFGLARPCHWHSVGVRLTASGTEARTGSLPCELLLVARAGSLPCELRRLVARPSVSHTHDHWHDGRRANLKPKRRTQASSHSAMPDIQAAGWRHIGRMTMISPSRLLASTSIRGFGCPGEPARASAGH